MKALKAFIKPFEEPQRSFEIKIKLIKYLKSFPSKGCPDMLLKFVKENICSKKGFLFPPL